MEDPIFVETIAGMWWRWCAEHDYEPLAPDGLKVLRSSKRDGYVMRARKNGIYYWVYVPGNELPERGFYPQRIFP